MMGEQKHKVFKPHAPHTNPRDSVLQLMKATNTLQTIRFLLDGAFQTSSPATTKQLQMVVESVLLYAAVSQVRSYTGMSSMNKGRGLCKAWGMGGLYGKHRLFAFLTGKCLNGLTDRAEGYILADSRHDIICLPDVYQSEYSVALYPNTPLRVKYWRYLSGDPESLSRLPRFEVSVNDFLRLRGEPFPFHCVVRIFTVTIGSMVRLFFVLSVL